MKTALQLLIGPSPRRFNVSVATLSHYELLEQIAEGGMGVVYKARDIKLDRLVALKLISPDLRAKKEEVERLFEEARAISRLNHPNVATVYEVDDTSQEPFMALEYLPGGTLRKRVREVSSNGGHLSPRQVVDYAEQIAMALAHAHRHGIIHRDVKTDNVLLTAENQVKLTDFGVAQALGRSHNGDLSVGTVAYMSPEQAQGLATDHRSDIFSFGIVLFEMAAGQIPFRGDREELILYELVNSSAPPLTDFRSDLPDGLQRIIGKSLEKQPQDRYQSMEDVLRDLRATRDELRTGLTRPREVRPVDPTIAVLPFVDMSPDKDQEYFCDGITEEIINALTAVKGLKVVSRSSAFQFKGGAYDIREIGRKLGVRTVLEGSVRKVRDQFRITAQLINVGDGYHLWSQRFDRRMCDVFAVQDEISQAIVEHLRVRLVSGRPSQIVKKWTENLEVYNLYLQGRYFLNQRTQPGIQKAIELLEKAACEDCGYALPNAGLAEAYILQATSGVSTGDPRDILAKAREAACRAIELDDACPEAHVALALVHYRADWDWEATEKEFCRAIELNDGHAPAHHHFAMFLAAMNRIDEALAEVFRAHELDPLSLIISTAVGRILHFARRYDEAIEQYHRTFELNPQFANAHFDLAVTYGQLGRYEESINEFKTWAELLGDPKRATVGIARVFAEMGRHDKARQLLDEVVELSKTRYVSPALTGIILLGLGEVERAFDLIEQSLEQRDTLLVYVQCEPTFDRLRAHPRYRKLIEKMKFPTVEGAASQATAPQSVRGRG